MITMDEIYEPLIWVALPLLSCASAATQVNVRSCWSTPSMSYISASLITGFIQASSSSLVIMEYVHVYFNVQYSLIFLFWLILVFTVQTSKLIFLTPYQMPSDKSEISLYDASWVLGKCRRKSKSEVVMDLKEKSEMIQKENENKFEGVTFRSLLRGKLALLMYYTLYYTLYCIIH